jgi:hypothetical protein
VKDKDETPTVIDLADRRQTPKELPAFAPPEPDPEQTRLRDEFWATMSPLSEGLQEVQGTLLGLLIQLALPELDRLPLRTIREDLRGVQGMPEALLRAYEAGLGNYPARLREAEWLDEHAYPLANDYFQYGAQDSQPHDTGVLVERRVYLLVDGRMVLVHVSGIWKQQSGFAWDTLTTPICAEFIEPVQAVHHFAFNQFVWELRNILWDQELPVGPPGPDLEQRRARFLAVVGKLSEATAAYVDRIRRAAITPV